MSTYVVGDLQGCLQPLLRLLDQVGFDPQRDKLWCTGDLVNRGPESLATLRYIYALGDSCISVLGNHDLHLLALGFGQATPKKSDTLDEILAADDAYTLLQWLRRRPLIHHEQGFTLVHAGIAPQWTITEALQYAGEVENALRGDGLLPFLQHMYGNQPAQWQSELAGLERLRVITNYCTRMRFCHDDGSLDLNNKKGPADASPGTRPWFLLPGRKAAVDNIVFGHWAALLGKADTAHVYALDTGCIWGESLTMLRLDDLQQFSCPCRQGGC